MSTWHLLEFVEQLGSIAFQAATQQNAMAARHFKLFGLDD